MRIVLLILLFGFILPLALNAIAYALSDRQEHWSRADRSPAGLAPDPSAHPGAIVQIYAAPAYRWRGIFSVHTWIAIKGEDERAYTRYDVMGWGRPLRVNGYAADARWFGQEPTIVHELTGEGAAEVVTDIREAVERYPYGDHGGYTLFPGPNSNSFVAWVAREVDGLDVRLPPNAIGKDFSEGWLSVLPTPSNTGWQVSFGGFAGAAFGWAEGIEIHFMGSTLGLDFTRPAVKIPFVGRFGVAAS